jgi:hypothetical protein
MGDKCAALSAGDAADELLVRAAAEVDQSLLDWYQELTITERLRAASRNAATLERLARAASTNH